MSTIVSTRSSGSLNPTRQQLDELEALLNRMLDLPVNQLGATHAVEEADEEPAAPAPVPAVEPRPAASPISYMVVETASPRPLPTASGFEPRPSVLAPRLAPLAPPRERPVEDMPAPAAPPAPTMKPAPMPAVEAPPAEAEVWVPLRSTWQPSAQTWQPLAESWQQANGTASAPADMPAPIPAAKLDPTTPTTPMLVGQASRLPQAATGETPVPPAPPTPAEPRLSLSEEDAPVAVSLLLLPLVWFNQGFDGCVAPLGGVGRWLCGPRDAKPSGPWAC